MLKFKNLILVFFIFVGFSYANEKVNILANNVVTSDNTLVASGDVLMYSKNYYITAKKVIYDKKLQTFELFDDVVIIKNNETQLQSNYAFLDLPNDLMNQKPGFILDRKTNIWIDTKDFKKVDNVFLLNDSVISSCDCLDPAWSLRFSSGSYDEKNKWIHTYNTRIHLKSVPIFYLPYFGFPTDTTRRTGLLKPTLGYSQEEGFVYFQPIYFAPQDNYDIEIVPQVKSIRGKGLYAYYRYSDSKYSTLKIKTGLFQENNSYFIDNSLDYKEHYGYNIDYKRDNLFSNNSSTKDGLFVDYNWLNDVEYITLEGKDGSTSTDKEVESKLNYYFTSSAYYFGTYLRYYLDTSLDNNGSTLQQLPQVQLHKYTDSLFTNKLNYSVDVITTKYSRNVGINANRTDLLVPLSFNLPILNDYLTFSIKNKVKAIKIDYSNYVGVEDAYFLENIYSMGISTSLLKPYKNFIHTLSLSTEIIASDIKKQNGDIYGINSQNSDLSNFLINETSKNIDINFSQTFFNKSTLKEVVTQEIVQSIDIDDENKTTLRDIEHELEFNFYNNSLYNRIVYNNIDKEFVESSSELDLNFDILSFNFTHYNSKKTDNSGHEDLESFTLSTKYNINKRNYIAYSEKYNLRENSVSKQSYSYGVNEKCWALILKYENELVASSNETDEAIRQNTIYLTLELKPIGAFDYENKLSDTKE